MLEIQLPDLYLQRAGPGLGSLTHPHQREVAAAPWGVRRLGSRSVGREREATWKDRWRGLRGAAGAGLGGDGSGLRGRPGGCSSPGPAGPCDFMPELAVLRVGRAEAGRALGFPAFPVAPGAASMLQGGAFCSEAQPASQARCWPRTSATGTSPEQHEYQQLTPFFTVSSVYLFRVVHGHSPSSRPVCNVMSCSPAKYTLSFPVRVHFILWK